MPTTPETSDVLDFRSLTGPEFDDAVSGQWHGEGRVTPAWLKSPKLKYYMPRSCLVHGPDKRQLFLCVVPSPTPERPNYREAVGVLELEVSPYDDGVVWLKYITVHPKFQRRGIARQLLAMMVTYLQANPRRLERSRPSEEGAVRIKGYIDQLLDSVKLPWAQSGQS